MNSLEEGIHIAELGEQMHRATPGEEIHLATPEDGIHLATRCDEIRPTTPVKLEHPVTQYEAPYAEQDEGKTVADSGALCRRPTVLARGDSGIFDATPSPVQTPFNGSSRRGSPDSGRGTPGSGLGTPDSGRGTPGSDNSLCGHFNNRLPIVNEEGACVSEISDMTRCVSCTSPKELHTQMPRRRDFEKEVISIEVFSL